MSEEAFDLVKGSLARRKQSATTVMLAEPTPQEIEALFLERITPETELPPMQPLFRMNEENCFYRGELVADCGKAKSGKTFFLSILMAGALKKQMLALERLCEEPLKVLWIDTEQSQQSTQEILKDRIMPLADIESLTSTTRCRRHSSWNISWHSPRTRTAVSSVCSTRTRANRTATCAAPSVPN